MLASLHQALAYSGHFSVRQNILCAGNMLQVSAYRIDSF